MTVLIFILCILVLSGMGYKTYGEVTSRNTFGISARQKDLVSWPGKMVLKKYHALPKENRPAANVPAIIKALDVKYGANEASKHFSKYERNYGAGPDSTTYAWRNCGCSTVYNNKAGAYERKCIMDEYRELASAIEDIEDAIAEQKRALEIASVDGDLENAKALKERLHEERDLIAKATSELS